MEHLRNKRLPPASQLAALLVTALSLAVFGVEVDGVAAKVGSETVLRSDVYLEMRRLNAPESAFDDVRNEMIDRKLVLRAASDAKMTMQEWVVESRVRDIIKRAFEGDRSKLMEMLAKQKISYPEWRARVKEDMIVSAMRWNMIDKNVSARPLSILADKVPGVAWFTDSTQAFCDYTIEDGIVKSDNVYIEGSVFSIKMYGSYDSVRDSLNFTARVQFSKKDSLVGRVLHPLTWPFTKLLLEFRLSGTTESPKWTYISVIDRVLESTR